MDRKLFIKNDKIGLADYIESDYKLLFDSWREDDTILGYNYKLPYSFNEYCDYIKNSDTWGAVVIRLEDNLVIGRIGISLGLPDLTITIFKPYRNQKIGTMAFSLGVKYCFEVLNLDKIYAGCYEDNISSKRMIEQCGFKPNPTGNDMEQHIFTGEDRSQLDFVIENPKMSLNYEIRKNSLTAKDLLAFRQSAGWGSIPEHQIETGLKKSFYTMTVVCDEKVIGIGRIVGDGVTICYIQDIIVLPEYQGKGIGTAIMENLLSHIQENGFENTHIAIGLFSAKGKEDFYKKFGFQIRPNENRGAGMEFIMKIT
jgi:RimJ/RimL family protein N-acetyltransferase